MVQTEVLQQSYLLQVYLPRLWLACLQYLLKESFMLSFITCISSFSSLLSFIQVALHA